VNRSPVLVAAAAGCALVAVLVAAAALHGTVTLVYDTSGNGCRTLMDASARELTRAMVPVRLLVVAWILATGVALSGRLSRTAGRARDSVQVAGTAGAVLLAIWLQFFIGTDALALLVPLAGLWLLVLIAVLVLVAVAMAQRHRPAAPRIWSLTGWLLLTGGALPVLLHAVTDSGAVRSC
jgi:hypothetical protein